MKRWLIFLAVEVFVYVGGIILIRIGRFTDLGNVFLIMAVLVPMVAWMRARGEKVTRIRTRFYSWLKEKPREGYIACILVLLVGWFMAAIFYGTYSLSHTLFWGFFLIAIALLVLPLAAIISLYD
jgi:hypothetical protein